MYEVISCDSKTRLLKYKIAPFCHDLHVADLNVQP